MDAVIKGITILLVVIAGIVLYPYLNPEDIGSFVSKNRVLAPVIFILICAMRPILFYLPSMGLTIVAGIVFGLFWGTLYVAVGGALSTITGFYFARWIGRGMVERIVRHNRVIKQMEEWALNHGRNIVLYMRLFNLPWDLVSYWAGLSGVRFGEFYRASMIALLPISFLYTYFGTKVFNPLSAGFILSLLVIIMLGSMPHIAGRLRRDIENTDRN